MSLACGKSRTAIANVTEVWSRNLADVASIDSSDLPKIDFWYFFWAAVVRSGSRMFVLSEC